MTHEDLRELLSGYALDALAAEEMRAIEAHLSGCEVCQRELAQLREVTGVLAEGVTAVEPPAALRSRILDAVRPSPRALIVPRQWTLGFSVVAAALLVVLGGVSLSLNHRLAILNERLAAQEQVLALLATPSTKTASLTGSVQASVRLLYNPGRKQGVLVVSDLSDPGKDFVYQLWLIAGQEPQSAGVFRPVPDQPLIVPVAADFTRYQAVAISIERGPRGVQRPTTTPILVSTI